MFKKTDIKEHFDEIAEKYDYYKKKNWYYYFQLKDFYRSMIPTGTNVLEIGCGTGDILSSVDPGRGVGIDINPKMIEIAQKKHPNLEFMVSETENLKVEEKFDYIILADMVEHLEDVWIAINEMKKVTTPESRIIISSINPLWSIPLHIAENLKLKMPEWPHNWMSSKVLKPLFILNDFEIIDEGYRILLPKKIPILSGLTNSIFHRLPLIKNLGLVQYVIVKPKPSEGLESAEDELTVSVIIPAYNEEGNIRQCVERTPHMGKQTEIIVVDDGSTDGTLEVIKSLSNKDKCRIVHYSKNEGKGVAVKKGLDAAKGDVLMILDADMTVPPEELPRFLKPLAGGKARFVNGTRMVYPMENQAMANLHLIGNSFFSRIFTWLLSQYVSDTLCGTKALFKNDYTKMTMKEPSWPDYDLLFGAAKLGLKIVEMPIHYKRREAGESKMRTFKHGFLLMKMCLNGFMKLKLRLS